MAKKKVKKDIEEEKITVAPISVDAMIEENQAAVVTSDYQRYIRRKMKEAAGRL